MSKKIYLSVICGVFIVFGLQKSYSQTNMTIILLNGTDEKIPLTEIKSVRFMNNGLNVFLTSGTNSVFELSQIKKLLFKAVSAIEPLENKSIQIYPNPVKDELFIKNAEQFSGLITIYGIDGRKVLVKNISEKDGIDVSALSRGVYILTVNNQAQKFSKQ